MAIAGLVQKLWDLRCLAAARLSGDQHKRVGRNGLHDFLVNRTARERRSSSHGAVSW